MEPNHRKGMEQNRKKVVRRHSATLTYTLKPSGRRWDRSIMHRRSISKSGADRDPNLFSLCLWFWFFDFIPSVIESNNTTDQCKGISLGTKTFVERRGMKKGLKKIEINRTPWKIERIEIRRMEEFDVKKEFIHEFRSRQMGCSEIIRPNRTQ